MHPGHSNCHTAIWVQILKVTDSTTISSIAPDPITDNIITQTQLRSRAVDGEYRGQKLKLKLSSPVTDLSPKS